MERLAYEQLVPPVFNSKRKTLPVHSHSMNPGDLYYFLKNKRAATAKQMANQSILLFKSIMHVRCSVKILFYKIMITITTITFKVGEPHSFSHRKNKLLIYRSIDRNKSRDNPIYHTINKRHCHSEF